LGDLIRNGAKTISLQTLFGRLNYYHTHGKHAHDYTTEITLTTNMLTITITLMANMLTITPQRSHSRQTCSRLHHRDHTHGKHAHDYITEITLTANMLTITPQRSHSRQTCSRLHHRDHTHGKHAHDYTTEIVYL
jgi:Tfp pilus assembly protein PilZ